MTAIVTLTPNPAIDVSTSVERMTAFRKLRCGATRRDPGGGGINVARVVNRLGGDVTAIFPAGGATGQLLRRLVDREHVRSVTIPAVEETREDFTVLEQATGHQYRFVFSGELSAEGEWAACLDVLSKLVPHPAFVVGSGSLPRGVPDDFYARAARIAKGFGAKMVIDTSGPALKCALDEGVYLLKPNLGELRGLVGASLADETARAAAARDLVRAGAAELVALSLGDEGALLATRAGAFRAPAVKVKLESAVGAGDSFLGGMVWALADGKPAVEAFRYGVAAASAAVLSAGTELCHADDVQRLHGEVCVEPIDDGSA